MLEKRVILSPQELNELAGQNFFKKGFFFKEVSIEDKDGKIISTDDYNIVIVFSNKEEDSFFAKNKVELSSSEMGVLLNTPIDELNLNSAVRRNLKREGIDTLGKILDFFKNRRKVKVKNLAARSILKIEHLLTTKRLI